MSSDDAPRFPVATTPEERREAQIRVGNRRAKVAAMILQRVSLREIAQALECTVKTIRRDKKKLLESWSREAGTRIDLAVGRELAALDQDEKTLRIAMRDEKNPVVRLKFFDRIAAIGVERRKLLGLDAAAKIGIRFEGNMSATTEIRDRDFYVAMLSDPEARAALLDGWRSKAGLASGPLAAPVATNGNGKPH